MAVGVRPHQPDQLQLVFGDPRLERAGLPGLLRGPQAEAVDEGGRLCHVQSGARKGGEESD